MHRWLAILVPILLIAACSTPQAEVGFAPPTEEWAAMPEFEPFDGAPLSNQKGEYFATAGTCAACHVNQVDESGKDVSIDAAWTASTMANAAHDPYWQAGVRAEAMENPALQAVIEDKCSTCHMPLARSADAAAGGQGVVLDAGYTDTASPQHDYAMDGVSCTLCHQIEPTGFGEREGFSGHYTIDYARPVGEREVFGPFPVEPGLDVVMQASSGFVPQEASHIQQSEQCGTCHNLYTPYVDAAGKVVGEFPEQMVYSEWLNSGFAETQSCQACHMPAAEGAVQLSITGGPARQPFRQHSFAGSNVYMLSLLRGVGDELGLTTSSADLDAALASTEAMLAGQTAELAVDSVQFSDGVLTAEVTVTNLAGHKFPTAYPSRRAWLHITVQDARGQIVFESGAVGDEGQIAGNASDDDPAAFEPHYEVITDPGEVQIYEAVMGNTDGVPTTTLLRGAVYLKDNRLLPAGFDLAAASADIAVMGDAGQDADFTAGGDVVRLELPLGEADGPLTLTVSLSYQSIGYRWVQNLATHDAPEIERFMSYYALVPNLPFTVASVSAEVQP